MILADITLTDILWWTVMMFFFIIVLWMIFGIIGDIFRSDDLSGVSKTLWCLFLIIAPWLMIFIYLIARGNGMADRSMKASLKAQQQYQEYVAQAAAAQGGGSATDQIAQAKSLLDSGAITQAEFDAIKAKALA